MEDLLGSLSASLDPVAAALLVALAFWVLLNGLEDVCIDLIGLHAAAQRRAGLGKLERQAVIEAPQKRIAIVVPCWQEHAVIGRMVQQNLEAVRYRHYDFFIGVYPNDTATITVVKVLAARYSNVHVAMCPHEGPTSKPDCLNWAWQAILAFEHEHGTRFEVLVTHDAEDVIHPFALHWINYYADRYGMVQVPVLPLPTPFSYWTHAVYCDEFSEYQTRDMPARDFMGAFIPSNGVGTGFRRDAVEALAGPAGHVFEPGCLTEDYENGYRLKRLGVRQVFLPLHTEGMATREFFPFPFRFAVKQRTRWVTGISLQTWDRHGWRGNLMTKYWLWRDRKGLLNNPAGTATNVLCLYAALSWSAGAIRGTEADLIRLLHPYSSVLGATALLSVHRTLYRMICVSRIFGWVFALGVPLRMVHANVINSLACVNAMRHFALSKIRRQPLKWAKTAHEYPGQVTFLLDKRRLGELLLARGVITGDQLAGALATQPRGVRLGEHLVRSGAAAERDIYDALGAQHGLPQRRVEPSEVPRWTARALPASVMRECRVIPFRVEFASMFLAAPDLPTKDLKSRLRRYTMLDLRFHLVTPSNFDELVTALL